MKLCAEMSLVAGLVLRSGLSRESSSLVVMRVRDLTGRKAVAVVKREERDVGDVEQRSRLFINQSVGKTAASNCTNPPKPLLREDQSV